MRTGTCRAETGSDCRRVAALDVGSNTVRAMAACLRPNGLLEPLHEDGAMTALGRGLCRTGRMSKSAMRATVTFIARFLDHCKPLDEVFCVGTAASRDASNASELLEALRERTGVELEVISGQEEARLSFLGALASETETPAGQIMVSDIGGRSTELVVGRKRPRRGLSLPLGARSLSDEMLLSDPPTRAEVRRALAAVREGLSQADKLMAGADSYVAAGGTAYAAALIAGGHWQLSFASLRAMRRRLCAMPLEQRREALSFDPTRAEVICGGLMILEALTDRVPGRRVQISRGGIREGLLLERTGARGIVWPADWRNGQ